MIENLIWILGIIFFILLAYVAFTYKTKGEKEYDKKIKESLADEFIIDPETGVKLTLEEAESGVWLNHDNEYRTISDEELNKFPTEGEKQAEVALNYLRANKDFKKTDLTHSELNKLEHTSILSSYDNWSYSNPFRFNQLILFFPQPGISRSSVYHSDEYSESHTMLWVKIESIEGHYLFREKSSSEKFFDLIRNDDDIKLSNYECFTIKPSKSIIKIRRLLDEVISEKDLLIEIDNENLFVKTMRFINLEDVERLVLLSRRVSNLSE